MEALTGLQVQQGKLILDQGSRAPVVQQAAEALALELRCIPLEALGAQVRRELQSGQSKAKEAIASGSQQAYKNA